MLEGLLTFLWHVFFYALINVSIQQLDVIIMFTVIVMAVVSFHFAKRKMFFMLYTYIWYGSVCFCPSAEYGLPTRTNTKAQFRSSMRGARDSRTRFARIVKFNRIHCMCLFNAHMYVYIYAR